MGKLLPLPFKSVHKRSMGGRVGKVVISASKSINTRQCVNASASSQKNSTREKIRASNVVGTRTFSFVLLATGDFIVHVAVTLVADEITSAVSVFVAISIAAVQFIVVVVVIIIVVFLDAVIYILSAISIATGDTLVPITARERGEQAGEYRFGMEARGICSQITKYDYAC